MTSGHCLIQTIKKRILVQKSCLQFLLQRLSFLKVSTVQSINFSKYQVKTSVSSKSRQRQTSDKRSKRKIKKKEKIVKKREREIFWKYQKVAWGLELVFVVVWLNEWMCHFCLSLIPINSLVRIWHQKKWWGERWWKKERNREKRREEMQRKKQEKEERKMLNPMLEWNQIIDSIKSIPIKNMNGWWVMN